MDKNNERDTKTLRGASKKKIIIIVAVVLVIAIVAIVVGVVAYTQSISHKQFTITFYSHGEEVDSVVYKYKDRVTLPVLDDEEGYTFLGWLLDGERIDDSFFDKYDFEKDLELDADWGILDAVTITYVPMGGSSVAPQQVARGTLAKTTGETTRADYYFLGWCYDVQCLCLFEPLLDVVNTDLTLYAKWIKRTIGEDDVVTVRYNSMGGAAVPEESVTYGNPLELVGEIYQEGFHFEGWYSDESYRYQAESGTLLTNNCVLYAKWVVYDTPMVISFVMPDGAPPMNSLSFAYGTLIKSDFYSPPTWEDYSFVGLYLDPQFSEKEGFPYYITSDKTYHLKYEAVNVQEVVVTYNMYEDQISLEHYQLGATVELWTPGRIGYDFQGWYLDSGFTKAAVAGEVKAREGLTLWAKWTEKESYEDEDLTYSLAEGGAYLIVTGAKNGLSGDVTIPATVGSLPVKEIAEGVFMYKNVTSVTIGSNVERIGREAFAGTSLTSVTLPVNVRYVGERAFAESNSLASVSMLGQPSVGIQAFYNCQSLTSVSCPYVLSFEDNVFGNCYLLAEVDMRAITALGIGVFRNCRALASVNMDSASITSIPDSTFNGCRSLFSVGIPSTVVSIGAYAFKDCALTKIDTQNVRTIGNQAFDSCRNLEEVRFRAAFESYDGESPLLNCPKVSTLTVDGLNTHFCSVENSLYDYAKTKLILAVGKNVAFMLPATVTAISAPAFMYCSFSSISVASGNTAYTSVGGNLYTADGRTLLVYASAKSSATFAVPDGVVELSTLSVANSASLEEVVLPATITTIGMGAFYNLTSLSTIRCANAAVKAIFDGNPNCVYMCGDVSIVVEEE